MTDDACYVKARHLPLCMCMCMSECVCVCVYACQ